MLFKNKDAITHKPRIFLLWTAYNQTYGTLGYNINHALSFWEMITSEDGD